MRAAWSEVPLTPADTAFECETLCPSENVELSPSIFLPNQIEKIIGVPAGSSLQSQFEQVLRRRVNHAPTLAFHIKNATAFDGAIYAGRMKHLIGDKRASSSRRIFDLGTGAVCSSWSGTKYFGHWLCADPSARQKLWHHNLRFKGVSIQPSADV
jgi:hypothetical protein